MAKEVAAEVFPETLNAAAALIDENVKCGRGDRVAIYYEEWSIGRETGKTTYKELMELTNKMGNALKELGIHPWDRVAIMAYDMVEHAVSFMGAIKIGAIPVSLSPFLPPESIKYILTDNGARAIIGAEEPIDKVEKMKGELKHLEHTIVIGKSNGNQLSFDKLLKEASSEPIPEETHRDAPCCINYTSGTTGPPKGAVHLQHDLPWNADSYAIPMWKLTEDDIFLGTWPLFFLAGLLPKMAFMWRAGAATVLWPGNPPGRLQPEDFFQLIEKYNVTILGGVPTFFLRMLQLKDEEKKHNLSSVRLCISGAEPLIPTVVQGFKDKFGVEVIDVLGSTEMGYYLSSEIGSDSKGLKTGPGTGVKLMDEDGNEISSPNKRGKMLIKNDAAAASYWNKHEETKRLMKGEWFDSGDMYINDEQGFYWYQGRADEMIRQKGFWISPKKLENVVTEYPAVLEAAAIQSYDEERLPIAKIFVVIKEKFIPSPQFAQEIRDFMKSKLPFYEVPSIVDFIDVLPRLPTGKVSRLILKQGEEKRTLS